MPEKKKLLVSFSGGETSAFMALWCRKHLADEFDMVVVFANTGEEREETLEFVRQCDEALGFGTVWVEAVVHHGERRASSHRVVTFETASRNGEPFEAVIQKYGIPNARFPHCTREMKTNPITSYVRDGLGWQDYYTAIGIRADEIDRMDPRFRERRYLYPLCEHRPTTKPEINAFWAAQPFRLELKGYQGNCRACWKKSLRKLLTIAAEEPEAFDNMRRWEQEYGTYTPPSRSERSQPPYTFYRHGMSVEDILAEAQRAEFAPAVDDSLPTAVQGRLFGGDGFDALPVLGDLDRADGGCDDHCEPF